MIKRLAYLFLFFTLINCTYSTDFISQWNTSVSTGNVTNSTSIKLPLESVGTYNFYVDWGDGTNNTITVWNETNITHDYAVEGVKTVRINGTIIGFVFNYTGDRDKILNIEQWGDLRVGNSTSYFAGCSNLNSNATDALNLTGTTILKSMFESASNFNGSINNWDVSKIKDMSLMFLDANNFNQPLNNWNTSSVTDMSYIFYSANNFNQPLNNWNTISVIDMSGMFNWAVRFNGNISNWNTSSVTNMENMFKMAWVFNQPLNNWNTSNVINMAGMFNDAQLFNQPLNNWNTSSVINMYEIFFLASNFNGNISTWDVSHVTTMESMFRNTNFNKDISNWNTSSVTEMYQMFNGATNFNGNISNWDTSQVTSMYGMFYGATIFNQNLTNWCVPNTLNTRFSTSSALSAENKPVWGTCPNRELSISLTNFSEGTIYVNYTYIRADANTNINSCKLNWNGTWFNMTRSGSYCYLNKTGTFNNTYSYYVEANRSNVFNVTSTKIVTMSIASTPSATSSGFNIFPAYGIYSAILTFILLIGNFLFN